jgi:hypothetical protein
VQFKIHGTVWHTPVEKRKKEKKGDKHRNPSPKQEEPGNP